MYSYSDQKRKKENNAVRGHMFPTRIPSRQIENSSVFRYNLSHVFSTDAQLPTDGAT